MTPRAATAATEPLLELRDLDVSYGQVHALRNVSLQVNRGEIVTLIGSNGAGKSSTLRAISGLVRPRSGEVRIEGKVTNRFGAEKIARLGVAHAPEGRRLFPRMTVRENLEMGAYARKDRQGLADAFSRVYELFPRIHERRRQMAGSLSGGEQQMVAIARALMSDPQLLLLDEPSLGLAPVLVETIFSVIREIHAQGGTILLIEQNALLALQTASRGYVLETGNVAISGSAQELLDSEAVQRAYLGM